MVHTLVITDDFGFTCHQDGDESTVRDGHRNRDPGTTVRETALEASALERSEHCPSLELTRADRGRAKTVRTGEFEIRVG